MNKFIEIKKIVLVLIILGFGLGYSDAAQNIKICGIRVAFPVDDNEATSGNGQFLLSKDSVDMNILEPLPIDPPPHNKAYFRDHIQSVSNYFEHASRGMVQVDMANTDIYPESQNGAFQVPHEMAYYHPFLKEDSVDIRLNELIRDAINVADQDVDYSKYDLVVIFHAGLGQIYDIDLDPTPKDIKSAYMGVEDFQEFLGEQYKNGITVDNGEHKVKDAIILPETQNYIQYDNWDEVFGDIDNPEDYQFGLNGTFALMMGYYLGLPSLSDTTGGAGAGQFGLMDQGSANLNSLVPAMPSAWERYYLGWEEPEVINQSRHNIQANHIESEEGARIYKIPIDNDEYFLIENRCNFLSKRNLNLDTLRNRKRRANEEKYEEIYPSLLPFIKDTIGAQFSENGVLMSVPRYDVGIAGSGLLIWHIDESIIEQHIADNYVNISPETHGVDLVEGDGAQDLGAEADIFTRDVVMGWAFDPWFAENEGFLDLNEEFNPNYNWLGTRDFAELGVEDSIDAIEEVGFTPYTIPNTSNNSQAFSGIYIDSIGQADFTMSFRVHWDQEAGEKILFNEVESDAVLDILPIDLVGIKDGLAVLDNKLKIYSKFTKQGQNYSSDNSVDFSAYDKATLLYAKNESNIVALAESAEKYKVACWTLNSQGELSFIDSLVNNDIKFTSNPVALDNEVIVGATSKDQNYLYKFTMASKTINVTSQKVSDPINALAGASSQFYYLSHGSVGEIDHVDLSTSVILDNNQIQGNQLYYAVVDNKDIKNLVFTGQENVGIIRDIGQENSFENITLNSIAGVSLADIDADQKYEILVATSSGQLRAYNSELVLENNFPIEIGTDLLGEPFASDIDGGIAPEIFTTSVNGALYSLNDKGQFVAKSPMTIGINNPDNRCLINTSQGAALISYNTTQATMFGKIFSQKTLARDGWFCKGGNSQRNYMPQLTIGIVGPPAKSILNKSKTFCWPNPVKQSTTNLRYFLNKSGRIKVQIYDLAGNFVETLKDDSPPVKDYNDIIWNVEDIESGTYIAVVKAIGDTGNSAKKLIKIMVIK